jgi:hypothetical protein
MPTLMTLHISFLFTRWNVDRYDVKLVHQNLFLWRFCIAVVIFFVVWQPLLGPERVSWPPRFVPAWIVASCLRCSVNWRSIKSLRAATRTSKLFHEFTRTGTSADLPAPRWESIHYDVFSQCFPATCGNLWISHLAEFGNERCNTGRWSISMPVKTSHAFILRHILMIFQLSKPDRYFFIQVTTQFIRSRGWVVQSGKTASGGCSVSRPRFVRAVAPRIINDLTI